MDNTAMVHKQRTSRAIIRAMPKCQLLKPLDGPTGRKRLLAEIAASLSDDVFERARFAVAFAKRGGVARLIPSLSEFQNRGGTLRVIAGLDLEGTSLEAAQMIEELADEFFFIHEPSWRCTFHPKLYLFDGPTAARALVGSHNLTSGGLETNYEAGIILDFALPQEQAEWDEYDSAWSELLPPQNVNAIRVNTETISNLSEAGFLHAERAFPSRVQRRGSGRGLFGSRRVVPPSPLPPNVSKLRGHRLPELSKPASYGDTLLIEIVPHHNGEVFFSKRALDQNRSFFRFPWTGATEPKRRGNPPYRRMDPNPQILVRVFDEQDAVVYREMHAPLLVLYDRKKEVRMTLGKDVFNHVPPFTLAVMREPNDQTPTGVDYELDLFPEGSPGYARLIDSCDQLLPSGGKGRARRMGWL